MSIISVSPFFIRPTTLVLMSLPRGVEGCLRHIYMCASGMSIISQEIKTPTIKRQIFVQFKLLNCSLFEEVVGYPCFSLRLPTTLLECKISYTYVLLPSYACVL